MLEPLNADKLRALLDDDDNEDYHQIQLAKMSFAKDDLAEGMKNLLDTFEMWVPHVHRDKKDSKNWYIKFRKPPLDTLYLRPCGGTIEIFRHENFLVAFGILGRPQNWARILQWLWAYGDKAYAAKVAKGPMLPPLDYRKLNSLVEDDNDSDCDSIRRIKACLGKEKDLARCTLCLFEGWDVFVPRIYWDKEVEKKWHIRFRNSPFRSLRIEPSIDHGVVDLYAFDDFYASFHVLDNPVTSDRVLWQSLLRHVYVYGRGRQEHKQQWEEKQRLSHKKNAKTQSQSKRTEKPLLHKVLHTNAFKAQRGPLPRTNKMRAVAEKGDEIMEDVDTAIHFDKSSNRQLFNQHSPLRATDPNARSGTSWKAEDTKNGHTTKVSIDDVNRGGLETMDCQP